MMGKPKIWDYMARYGALFNVLNLKLDKSI